MAQFFQSVQALPVARSGDLRRVHLLTRLDAARDAKVIVLAAGAGYGKSTLLSQWAASPHVRREFGGVVAVNLSNEQSEPTTFMRALLSACPERHPQLSLDAALTALNDSDVPRSVTECARALNLFPGSVLLLIDGAQHLGVHARQCLERLTHLLADGHQVVLTVYDPSTLPFLAVLAAQGQAAVLSAVDLSFTREEVQQLLVAHPTDGVGIAPVDALEGWPIAVGLLRSSSTLGVMSFEMLACWVLDRLSLDVRHVLQEMSVWDEWGEPEARHLGAAPLSAWLNAALEVGLPIAPLANDRARPHALLIRRLNTELNTRPQRAQACWLRAARVYEQAGQLRHAVRCAREGKDFPQALMLADRVTEQLMEIREFQQVRSVLEAFEFDVLPTELQEALGIAWYETGERLQSLACLRGLQRSQRLSVGAWLVLADHALLSGETSEAATLLALAEACVDTLRSWVQVGRFRAWSLIREHQYQQVLPLLETLVTQAETLGDGYELGACLALQGVVLFSTGQTDLGIRSLRREVAFCETHDAHFNAIKPRTNLALCLSFCGQLDEGLSEARRALDDAQTHGAPVLARVWISVVLIHHLRREFGEAHRVVKDALVAASNIPITPQEHAELWLHALSSAARTHDAVLREEAARQIDVYLRHIPYPTPPMWRFAQATAQFTLARLALLTDQPEHVTMENVARQIEQVLGPPTTYELHARLYLAEAQRRAAQPLQENLQIIGQLVAQTQARGVLFASEPDLPEIFALLKGQTWWASLFPTGANVSTVPARSCLRITTLRTCRAQLDGQAVHLPLAKGSELLVWLALHGPSRRADMIDALWDGSGRPTHAEYFRVLVRRVRAALSAVAPHGVNPLPFEDGVYQLSPAFDVQVDVLEVLQASTTSCEDTLQAATDMYRGAFLPELTSEWVVVYRAQVEDAALLNLQRLAEGRELTAPLQAVELYQRMLHIDPLSDPGYEGALRCFDRLGDRAGMEYLRRSRARLIASP